MLGWPVVALAGRKWGLSSCASVLWAFWGFVVKFLEELLHIARHGYVNIFFGIFPGEGEDTILCSFPID